MRWLMQRKRPDSAWSETYQHDILDLHRKSPTPQSRKQVKIKIVVNLQHGRCRIYNNKRLQDPSEFQVKKWFGLHADTKVYEHRATVT